MQENLPIYTIESTRELQIEQIGKFFFTHNDFAPIQLHEQHDKYAIWKVLPHSNAKFLQQNICRTVVIEVQSTIALSFTAKIEMVWEFGDIRYIRLPHTDTIEYLYHRKTPRVFLGSKGLLKILSQNGVHPMYVVDIIDISEGGAKIKIDEPITAKNINLSFRVLDKKISLDGYVLGSTTINDHRYYNIAFTNIRQMDKLFLEKLVYSRLKADTHGGLPSWLTLYEVPYHEFIPNKY
ncbi:MULTISPECIES: PilZ domain-containing protein [unclassified Nitratiruptor]|uniref:PilZ domain-containing protein n=1 Tax=unclassified Nitratiruptor TaxID=2624044 RepID=UPI0019160A24|nr:MULTISPECIES: PilZ domain-containing protein [unclassified Nitratiruptor]BCD60597.1 hypothetical protein NitYY0810_C1372 [Nitratiruptor sp. YY08-10]BCD64528.1 hypothetical protein NitYY0814_C1379 [Nitratiruptor sp. YY08-14]